MSQQGLRQQWTRDGLRLLAVAAALFVAVWGTDVGIAALPQAFDGGAQGAVEGRQPAGQTWAYVDSAALTDSGAVDLSGTSLYDDVPTYETLEGNDLAARVQRIRAGMGPLLDAQVHDGMAAVRLRELAAMLGAQFTWDGAGTALMTGMDGVIELTPGQPQVRRNYTPISLPGAPVVAGHDLFIPVRSAASALGLELKQEHDGAVVTLSGGAVAVRAIIPSQAFAIEIDRSERWLRVSYAGQLAKHYPACTGEGQNTPVGRFHILNKCVWPGWRAYWGEFIPGGTSRNPLGARFMGTSARGRATGWTIGIHGTNQPSSIGRRISGGCVRLHNRDIVELYEVIPIGTRVTIHE